MGELQSFFHQQDTHGMKEDMGFPNIVATVKNNTHCNIVKKKSSLLWSQVIHD